MNESLSAQLNNPKTVRAWCMYDWAISVYNLVITTTFFPIYFLGVTKSAYGENTVPFLGREFKNTSLYDYTLSFAYLAIALLLPILTSIADSRGNKKKFMQFFCYLGGLACIGMFWFGGGKPSVEWGLTCFIFATIGYVGSLVFYNSYLPEIAKPEDQDRISARGFSMGYVGSVLLQLIGFGLVIYFSGNGDETSGPLFTFLLTGFWWIGFAQITFAQLPEPKAPPVTGKNVWVAGFQELKKVWTQVKKLVVLKWFLIAFFFYSMGVQTVMLAATLFGQQTLGLPADKLIITVVLIQLVAIPGAIIMSRLSAKYGNVTVLMGVVLIWIVICFSAYYTAVLKENGNFVEYHFYGLAVLVGLVMGGVQSLSRSTYSKLMPPTNDTASFFSFYDVTEKIAIVIGTFAFGYIDEIFGMKHSALLLAVFFVLGVGALVITRNKEKQVRKALQAQLNTADV
ncbi:MFS transporter [Fulvivirgaceae bacterium PWU4]|uniref:MFS transporter n=1 Tax=Chryseosolibacter histidini TaxID=2782349 RepID=A0AAP2DIY8_9BACT|nr:MFS transporter [Chryseosolibacter histidini]MBT1695847.1 MFS transporter [Chryseosolibacter histidini]